jgi:hypothetical protein
MNNFDRFILVVLVLNCVLSAWGGNVDGALGWGAATCFLCCSGKERGESMKEKFYGLFELHYDSECEALHCISREEDRLTAYANAVDSDKEWVIKEVDFI